MTEIEETTPPLPPFWRRTVQIFIEPGALGEALRATPAWFGAFALGAVLVVIGTIFIPAEVWMEMTRQQLQASGQALPEGAGEMSGRFAQIGALVGGPIFWAIWIFLLSGILLGLFSFILGDDVRYKQILACVSHAMIIAAVGGLVTLPLRIAQSNPQLTLSVGTFMGQMENGWLARFLMGLDLFALWSTVVMGILISRLDPRRSTGSAVTALLVLTLGLTALIALIPRPI